MSTKRECSNLKMGCSAKLYLRKESYQHEHWVYMLAFVLHVFSHRIFAGRVSLPPFWLSVEIITVVVVSAKCHENNFKGWFIPICNLCTHPWNSYQYVTYVHSPGNRCKNKVIILWLKVKTSYNFLQKTEIK